MTVCMTNPWFVTYPARGQVRRRLICFPFAGGGASAFRLWPTDLPPDVEVLAAQLPGRERRHGEPPLNDCAEVVSALVTALVPLLDRPFAFFGHSMGAVLAFEVTRRLAAQGLAQPAVLAVSARRAPHLAGTKPPIHDLPDDRFIAELSTFQGTPQAVLDNAELMELLLPALRADFRLIETYRPGPGPERLDVPLWAVGGHDDGEASSEQIQAWSAHAAGSFETAMFAGGHFFLNTHRGALLAALAAVMERHVP